MAKNKGFKVPEAERKAYKLLVQQANRTIKSNFKYIEKNNITDNRVIERLVFDYADKENWMRNKKGEIGKSPLSRSIQFSSEREYRAYLHHLEKWGSSNARKKAEDYKKKVLDTLQRISIIHNIQLPDNKIPDDIKKAIDSMSLQQLENWFELGSPAEDLEVSDTGSETYIGVNDYEHFRDLTFKRLGWIKKVY